MTEMPTTLTTALAAGQKAVAVDAAMIAKLTDMAGDFAVNLSIALLILVVTVFASAVSAWKSSLTGRTFAVPAPWEVDMRMPPFSEVEIELNRSVRFDIDMFIPHIK